ncbi:MAG: helix-turn-helix transcriptional regulator, partial [Chloroflexota bacterium]
MESIAIMAHVKTANLPFAEAIQTLRVRAEKSTYAVARKCMGWNSESPYLLIEQGRRMPDQDTIIRLVKCLDGTFADQCLLMGLAGYLPPMQVPTLAQIQKELQPIIETIQGYPYPVYLLDRSFTYWVANPAAKMLVNRMNNVDSLGEQHASAFDLSFDSRLGIANRIKNIEALRQEQVRRFKGLNVLHQHEGFYRFFLKHMQERLLAEDYQVFDTVWQSTSIEQRYTAAMQELGYIRFAVGEEVEIEFNFFADRVFFL